MTSHSLTLHVDGKDVPIHHVTSDHHIGHTNIIRYCDRPYADTSHMNMELLRAWNTEVTPTQNVLLLGDIALGNIEQSLAYWKRFTGTKYLIPGNHDRISSLYSAGHQARHRHLYEDAGFVILPEMGVMLRSNACDVPVLASHYPYSNDYLEGGVDKFARLRPKNTGFPLLHGHTHSRYATDPDRPLELHVGVDAWGYKPVSAGQINVWLRTLQACTDRRVQALPRR